MHNIPLYIFKMYQYSLIGFPFRSHSVAAGKRYTYNIAIFMIVSIYSSGLTSYSIIHCLVLSSCPLYTDT